MMMMALMMMIVMMMIRLFRMMIRLFSMIIMPECSGSAAIGHLLLSEHTYSHFAQVRLQTDRQTDRLFLGVRMPSKVTPTKSQGIGQSGSALASWAFDRHPVHHAKNIAAKVVMIMMMMIIIPIFWGTLC